jgi:cytochrome c553
MMSFGKLKPVSAVLLLFLLFALATVGITQASESAADLLSARIDLAGSLERAQYESRRQGEKLAEGCALCHGVDGNKQHITKANLPIPNLAAQQPLYLLKQLLNFQTGERNQSLMHGISKNYSNDDFVTLALYFSANTLKPYRVSASDTEINSGKQIFSRLCVHCHADGATGQGGIPRLHGQNPDYIESNLVRFRDKLRTRKHAAMSLITSKLTDQEIRLLSVYLAGL